MIGIAYLRIYKLTHFSCACNSFTATHSLVSLHVCMLSLYCTYYYACSSSVVCVCGQFILLLYCVMRSFGAVTAGERGNGRFGIPIIANAVLLYPFVCS